MVTRREIDAALDALQSVRLEASPGIVLQLHRMPVPRPDAPAVLLTHGGNTISAIYLFPHGGLAGYLHEHGFDVWLLDWRGSARVVGPVLAQPPLGGSEQAERARYSMDAVAEEDFPVALAHIRGVIGPQHPLSIVAYCVSSGALSMSIARGAIEPFGVRRFVLLSLGLFYTVPWNGWIKAEDFILEQLLHVSPRCRDIDPRHPERWPKLFRDAYDAWPGSWLPQRRAPDDDMLRRLSFMIGTAWETEQLDPSMRSDVRDFFGAFHLGLYLHAGQMVRRGYAGPLNGSVSDLKPAHFDEHKHFSLICPQNNGVWHRSSVDRMFDWLRSHTRSTVEKRVIAGHNLHELLWGAQARTRAYPTILGGLSESLGP